MSLVIAGATILDGVAERPIEGCSLWIEEGRIQAIARPAELRVPAAAQVIDARGKYAIPGLMDANVHLIGDVRVETLVRHEDRFADIIAEAAQIALKNGLTTVFDTWGPRAPLMAVRDEINGGKRSGSRIFCAGNIVGLDGPYSRDFIVKALEYASGDLVEHINWVWAENVGPHLTWMTPEQVVAEVRAYIERGIDFLKYASSEHRIDSSAFLAFSPRVQRAIVEETHRAGLTAQAHASSVEALRISSEVGCDLIQHANITGPTLVPPDTFELLAERRTACTVFPFTKRRFDWIMQHADPLAHNRYCTVDENVANFVKTRVKLLLATDAWVMGAGTASDPLFKNHWGAAGEDNLAELGQGHFHWLEAMEQKGLPAMEGLRAATRNIAAAYRKDEDLGTLQPGKIADILLLDRNPLESAANYRSIHEVIKEGAIVDRAALPIHPIHTRPPVQRERGAASYRPEGDSRFPCC